MTSIVYDYAAIATALKGDDWWKPEKVEEFPELPNGISPLMRYVQEVERRMLDTFALKPGALVRVKLPPQRPFTRPTELNQ